MKKIILVIAVGILAFFGVFGAEQTGNEIPKFKSVEVINWNVKVPLKVILNQGAPVEKIGTITVRLQGSGSENSRPNKTIFFAGDSIKISTIQLFLGTTNEKVFAQQKINWAGPNANEGKLSQPLEGGIKLTLERDSIVKDKLVITITEFR